MTTENPRVVRRHQFSRSMLFAGWIAFAAALLIHNEFRLVNIARDIAIYPATIFTGLLLWKPNRWLSTVAAIMIALPALGFIEWAALTEPGETRRFLNQLFLLLAGVFAISGGIGGVAGPGKG